MTSPYFQPPKYDPTPLTSMSGADEPLPVVIVGGGPVGMSIALGLAQRGVPVTILEALDQVSFGSRAICISRHSLEAADRLGFGTQLAEIALPWVGGRSYYHDREVLHFQMPSSPRDVHPPMVNVSQSEFEQLQVDLIEAEPLITLVWQARVERYTQDGDVVTLEVETPAGSRTLRASWVVAADGGKSRMRQIAGVHLNGTSYEGRYVIADLHWEVDLPVERLVWFDPPSNPRSTVIMHQQPNNIWRIDYQLDELDDPEVERQEENIRARVTKHLEWLQNDVPWTLEWQGYYSAQARALDQFVHGRVLFTGDAAHLVPIFGVRGLNSGMEDAETLAWMLAAVVKGGASPDLLQAYGQERRAAWQQNIDNAGLSTLIMTPGTTGFRATRDAILRLSQTRPEFSHLINPRQSSATHAHTSPLTWYETTLEDGIRPGDPVPDAMVTVPGGEKQAFTALRGTGFAVIAVGADTATLEATAEQARQLAERLAPERVTAIALDPRGEAPAGMSVITDDDLAGDLNVAEGEVLVVRPDGLLLARLADTGSIASVADVVRSGAAPHAGQETPSWPDVVPEDVKHRENVWLTLSRAIDAAGAADEAGFLTRLAMVLGAQLDEETFTAALAAAAAGGAPDSGSSAERSPLPQKDRRERGE